MLHVCTLFPGRRLSHPRVLHPRLQRGGWHAFTVRLCNEMGLFDQQWPGCGPSLVRVRLLALGGGGVAAGARLRLRQVALH